MFLLSTRFQRPKDNADALSLRRWPRNWRTTNSEPAPANAAIEATGQGTTRLKKFVAQVATAALTGTALFAATPLSPAAAAPGDPVDITIKGEDVAAAAQSVNGLTFKGFGILSANSTSALLMDYKAQHPEAYWELIESLFGGENPVMNTVKIEMGNDRNTSTGPNAATMRFRNEYPNVQREPGFQLAADAQKVAEGDIHLSLLRWTRPTWVNNDRAQYVWFKNTALAAYREYGIMVDSMNMDYNENHNLNGSQNVFKNFAQWLDEEEMGYEGATESDPNNGWSSPQERELFKSIKRIAGDTVGTIPTPFGDALHTDAFLRDSIDIMGTHYTSDDPNNNLKRLVEDHDKEIWNSEGQATFSNTADRPNNNNSDEQGGSGTGMGGAGSALEMGNWITTGFKHSYRTLTIYQPAIGSFYDGFQYSSKELVSARDPWSGWIYYDGGLAVLEHFTQFAKMGRENEDNTAGIWRGIPKASDSQLGRGNPPTNARLGNNSYTTIAAPDASDFSTVIVNDSKHTKNYRITPEDLNLGSETVEVWETRAADSGQAYHENYLKPIAELEPNANGTYEITVKPFSMVTVTSLDHAESMGGKLSAKDGYGFSVPTSAEYTTAATNGRDVLDTDSTGAVNGVVDDEFLYADDFEYDHSSYADIPEYNAATGQLQPSGESFLESRGSKAKPAGTPNVTDASLGATPRYTNDTNGAFESVETADGRVLRQQIGPGMIGGRWNEGDPRTTIGDSRWANYEVSVDVLFEEGTGRYASLGARQQGGTSNGDHVAAAELRIDPDGAWSLRRYGSALRSGNLSSVPEASWKAGSNQWNTLSLRVAGDTYTALVNGVEITSFVDSQPQATGRLVLGSGFTFTQFDNLEVRTIDGFTPYYTHLIDGLHHTSWDDTSAAVLKYNNQWNHHTSQGMYVLMRTSSFSTGQGAQLAYTFTGTGLDIVGSNNGQATLNVFVDGVPVEFNARTWSANAASTTFMLRGLENTEHEVVIETANSSQLHVDAVGVITATADSSAVDLSGIQAALAAAPGDDDEGDYTVASWNSYVAIRDGAQRAMADPVAFGLDAEGAVALASRVEAAASRLVPNGISDDIQDLGAISLGVGDTLPATLDFDGSDVAVIWEAGAQARFADTAALGAVELTGHSAKKIGEVYQRFTVSVLATPDRLTYFIDSGANSGVDGSVHDGVLEAFPQLLNADADQQWDGAAAGKTWGYASQSSSREAGDAKDWGSSYLGADYNKPITYSLTLPAGTYNIVALQAPRPGITTHIYSTVRAQGHENRVTATSNGSGTPVSQSLTLDSEQVVSVEVGTNGTSGYNARLGLLYVQQATLDLGVQGAVVVDGDLPATVSLGGGTQTPVEWDVDSAAQSRALYELLHLEGVAGGQQVKATYEVVPAGLRYYIDGGTGGVESPQYKAVKDTFSALINKVPDRVAPNATEWGYQSAGMQVKGGTDINDKYSTGYWQDTTQLIYQLPLEAGNYELHAGFTEWWNMSRTMNHSVTIDGGEPIMGNIPLSGANPRVMSKLAFTLEEAATVTYLVTNEGAGGEKPVISWLAVHSLDDDGDNNGEDPDEILTPRNDYRIATYAGVEPQLPETIEFDNEDGEAVDVSVTWDAIDSSEIENPYTTANVTGSANETDVTLHIEVIPTGLTYFVDAATPVTQASTYQGQSPAYEAISQLVGAKLSNDVPDQRADDTTTWGLLQAIGSGSPYVAAKGPVAGAYNKTTTTGWYLAGSGGTSIDYEFAVEPGVYSVTTGYTEWWDQSRLIQPSVTFVAEGDSGDDATVVNGEVVTLTEGQSGTATMEITVTEPGVLTVASDRASGTQLPVLSWIGIALVNVDPTEIEATTPPAQTEYPFGTPLNLDGLEVTVTYADGSTAIVPVEALVVTGYDPNTPGEQVVTVSYTENGVTTSFTFTVTVAPNNNGGNTGGNNGNTTPPVVTPPVTKPTTPAKAVATTTTVKLSKSTFTYNLKRVVTVNVKAKSGKTKPSGTATVKVNGKSYRVTIKDGTGKFKLAAPVNVGRRTITASFTPKDSKAFVKSSGKATVTVTKAKVRASLKLSKKTVTTNQQATLNVKTKISGGLKAKASGVKVRVYDGKKLIRTTKLTKAGSVKVKLPKLKSGNHKIRVKISGNKNLRAKTSHTVTLKVRASTK